MGGAEYQKAVTSLKPYTMIPLYILLILSCLALGLIIFNVPISQKAINIILLIGMILVAVSGLWGDRLTL
jgi:hypothetical protein